nr:MAG TPA: hypothetical protein [Caudoviricetes sp.]
MISPLFICIFSSLFLFNIQLFTFFKKFIL